MRPTILIVDDEPELVELYRQSLEKKYRVLTAYNGEDGLALALRRQPHLVLLDIRMPRLNGYEMSEQMQVHEETRRIPIVMITAVEQTESIMQTKNLGVLDYMIKPIDLEELSRVVSRYVD